LGKIYKNPKDLTPLQYKYADEYMLKSGDSWEEFKSTPKEHTVFEWEDGWVDYTTTKEVLFDFEGKRIKKDIFWIYTIFSKGNTLKKFRDIQKVARDKYKCDVVRFSTLRSKGAWERELRIFKPKAIQTVFEMEIEK